MAAHHAISQPLDPAELIRQLRDITPPPDDSKDALERDARKWLRREKVPICDQKDCVPYWRTSGKEPYCAQQASWQAFQRERAAVTSRLQSERATRVKRRAMLAARCSYGLTHVDVRMDHQEKPDNTQTWIQYQDYLMAKDGQYHEGNSGSRGVKSGLARDREQIKHECFLQHVLPWIELVRLASASRATRRSGRTLNRRNAHGQPRGKIR